VVAGPEFFRFKDGEAVKKKALDPSHDLELIGQAIAKEKGYANLSGRTAVLRYLCDKHHWTPAVVAKISGPDLLFLLDGEYGAKFIAPKPPKRAKTIPASQVKT